MLDKSSSLFSEWIQQTEYKKEAEDILDYINKRKGLEYFKKFKERMIDIAQKFDDYSQKLRKELGDLDDRELVDKYEKFIIRYQKDFAPGIITFLYESILSEKLMQSLLARDKKSASLLEGLLSNGYKSFMIKSEEALLKIKLEKNKDKKEKLINSYLNKFFYIEANYNTAPVIDREYVLDRVKEVKRHQDIKARKIRIDLLSWEKQVVELLKITEVIRDKRKYINLVGSYLMDRFLDEIVIRRKIDSKVARRSFWYEYKDLMSNANEMMVKLKKRNSVSFVFDGKDVLCLEYSALKIRTNNSNKAEELLGTPASSGCYIGTVRKIMSREDFGKMKEGDILLTTMTRPEFVPLIKKAGAVITEEGGLTCHAAIVSREMSIPCIVGISNITEILKDGDRIKVDADNGTIKIIK